MRIVHLIDYYQPKIGYQEYFLAREHAKMGHQTHVVTSDRFYPFQDYDTVYKKLLGNRFIGSGIKIEEGIIVIRLKSFEIPKTNLIYLRNLKNTLFEIKPDLIICHGVYSVTSYLVTLYKNSLNFKLIYDTHAAAFNTDFKRSVTRRIYHYIYKNFLAPKILKNTDHIFAIGEAEQDFICNDLKLDKYKVPIIRLGVDINLFKHSKKARNKIRAKYKIEKDDRVIIFTGKITPNKDIHVLVEALEKLPKGKIILLLIGGGPSDYIDKLKNQMLKTRLIHIPFVKNFDLPEYYSAADIAVYPGDYTISVIEAMSCGLPVILPEWHGSSYLNKSGGIIRFKRNNVRDLFLKIKDLAYNKDLLKRLSAFNRKFIINQLTWEKIAKSVLNLIY